MCLILPNDTVSPNHLEKSFLARESLDFERFPFDSKFNKEKKGLELDEHRFQRDSELAERKIDLEKERMKDEKDEKEKDREFQKQLKNMNFLWSV